MKNDPKVFIEMYKEGLKFIPRDVNVTKDSKILIQLDIPTTNKGIDKDTNKAIGNTIDKAIVEDSIEDLVADSVSIDNTDSTDTIDTSGTSTT